MQVSSFSGRYSGIVYGGAAALALMANAFPFAALLTNTYSGVSKVQIIGVFFENTVPELHR